MIDIEQYEEYADAFEMEWADRVQTKIYRRERTARRKAKVEAMEARNADM